MEEGGNLYTLVCVAVQVCVLLPKFCSNRMKRQGLWEVWRLIPIVNLMRSRFTWDTGLCDCLWRVILSRLIEVRGPACSRWCHSLGQDLRLSKMEKVSWVAAFISLLMTTTYGEQLLPTPVTWISPPWWMTAPLNCEPKETFPTSSYFFQRILLQHLEK